MANTYTPVQNMAVTNNTEWNILKNSEIDRLAANPPKAEDTLSGTPAQDHTWYTSGRAGDNSRPVQEGTSGYDEFIMSDQSYAYVQDQKKGWYAEDDLYKAALKAGDTAKAEYHKARRDQYHTNAESERNWYGYSGYTDGSMHIPILDGEDPIGDYRQNAEQSAKQSQYDTQQLRDLLDQWKTAAQQQQDGKIDYAVQKAVLDLERALADAQPQFKEQAEAVAKDERQAMDNSALYAEARGDKGGIGKEQYNEIQAAAAQNRLAVQQAQTKLSTDTARQIADLRAQGEFEKADAALQIAQNYLSQLISLEQWAAEYNLSVEQFNESVRQWEAEFNLAMQQFQFDSNIALQQYKTDTDLAYGQLTGTIPSTGQMTLAAQKELASMGEALLGAGIMPSAEQLKAMGMTDSQAQQYLTAMQLEAAAKKGNGTSDGGGTPTVKVPDIGTDAWYQYIVDGAEKAGQSVGAFMDQHYKDLGLTSGMIDGYKSEVNRWVKANGSGGPDGTTETESGLTDNNDMSVFDSGSVKGLQLPGVSYSLLDRLVQEGKINAFTGKDGKIYVSWAPGWNSANYLTGQKMPTGIIFNTSTTATTGGRGLGAETGRG